MARDSALDPKAQVRIQDRLLRARIGEVHVHELEPAAAREVHDGAVALPHRRFRLQDLADAVEAWVRRS